MSREYFKDIESYYSKKIDQHGPTPKGVDWKNDESSLIRFQQIARMLPKSEFSISDVGCGYGALYSFLTDNNYSVNYQGFDLSLKMIEQAKTLLQNTDNATFSQIEKNEQIGVADYLVANGLFNLKFDHKNEAWTQFVKNSLTDFFEKCEKAMAVTFLTSYNDPEHTRPDLYYADPCALYDFSMKNLSRQSAILSDYPLFEFTLVVRKD